MNIIRKITQLLQNSTNLRDDGPPLIVADQVPCTLAAGNAGDEKMIDVIIDQADMPIGQVCCAQFTPYVVGVGIVNAQNIVLGHLNVWVRYHAGHAGGAISILYTLTRKDTFA